MTPTDELFFLAKVALECKRYDEVLDFIEKILETKGNDLTKNEREIIADTLDRSVIPIREAC